MKKLGKKLQMTCETVEAFACYCSCTCSMSALTVSTYGARKGSNTIK